MVTSTGRPQRLLASTCIKTLIPKSSLRKATLINKTNARLHTRDRPAISRKRLLREFALLGRLCGGGRLLPFGPPVDHSEGMAVVGVQRLYAPDTATTRSPNARRPSRGLRDHVWLRKGAGSAHTPRSAAC